MKLLLTSILIVGSSLSTLFACSCAAHSICKLLEFTKDDDRTLIFMGSYIQEVPINSSEKAFQFKIEKKYRGEVVTPNSPYYDGEPYINSEDKVWLLSGNGASCHRYLDDSNAIFIVTYNEEWPGHDSIGYVPNICTNDHFFISEDSIVNGAWPEDDFTMGLEEFEEMMTYGCDGPPILYSNKINIYPNPATDILNIEIDSAEDSWTVSLFDTSGDMLRETKDTSIDMSDFQPGIYFLVFKNGSNVRHKKIVKI